MKTAHVLSLVALVAIASTSLGHLLGQRSAQQEAALRSMYLSSLNAVASYSFHSDVANAIQSKKETTALCLINLRASAFVNRVRECLSDTECRRLLEPDIRRLAPELAGQGELKIKYFAEGEKCS